MQRTDDAGPSGLGALEIKAEAVGVTVATKGVAGLRGRHPWLYGIAAFVVGGAVATLFILSAYKYWAFETVDLKAAMYNVVFGGLGAGVASVALAFGYARLARTGSGQ
jgi:hypothetical protein